MPSIEQDAARKRKAHKKSRTGCHNCRLRRVKCDEEKPECQKCRAYGVSCNYERTDQDELQIAGEGAFIMENVVSVSDDSYHPPPLTLQHTQSKPSYEPMPADPPTPPSEFILNMLGHPLQLHATDETFTMAEREVQTLLYFQSKTVYTVGTAETVAIYRDVALQLACAGHDYLVHILLACALMHQRNENALERNMPTSPPSTAEAFHHYHGTATFHAMLRHTPLPAGERDAMWGAAALLSCLTIGACEARTAADCWPLRPDSPDGLDWLSMADGKKAVWTLADPLREDSLWRPSLLVYASDERGLDRTLPLASPTPFLDTLRPMLMRVFGFDESALAFPTRPSRLLMDNPAKGANDNGSSEVKDPYHSAVSIIVRLLPYEINHSTILYFLSFIGHMDPAFRRLLHAKDTKAMLLLAWWYAKLIDYEVWWLHRRCLLECRAICAYLGQKYMYFTEMGRLLDYPKMRCGMAVHNRYL